MRMIFVAGLLTAALFVAVLGAIGAQPPIFTPSASDEPGHSVSQRAPIGAPVEKYRG